MNHNYDHENTQTSSFDGRFLKELGQQIRYQRKLNNLTQERLGELSGVSYKYLGEIERGIKIPSIVILFRVAKSLGLNLSELLSFSTFPGKESEGILRPMIRLLEKQDPTTLKKVGEILRILLEDEKKHGR